MLDFVLDLSAWFTPKPLHFSTIYVSYKSIWDQPAGVWRTLNYVRAHTNVTFLINHQESLLMTLFISTLAFISHTFVRSIKSRFKIGCTDFFLSFYFILFITYTNFHFPSLAPDNSSIGWFWEQHCGLVLNAEWLQMILKSIELISKDAAPRNGIEW